MPASAAPTHSSDDSVSAPVTSSGKLAVMINVRQPQARIFYKGKELGKPPITVELEPGSRRSFEVVAPGFQTRKLVVDGSKAHIMIGLRAAPGTATTP